jgi:hypothetical protein
VTRDEVRAVLERVDGVPRLIALLLYGSGLRLLECCRLRVKDLDFATNPITIRGGKGGKDRMTMFPGAVKTDLAKHLERVRALHQRDLRHNAGWVELPWALARKYPNAGREWPWQWVFPATRFYVDRETTQRRRHHLHESVIQRAVPRGRAQDGHPQEGDVSHLPALLCDASAGGRARHPHSAGAARPQRCEHDDDLHPRPEPRPSSRAEPGGSDVPVMTRPALHRSATQDSKGAAAGGIAVHLRDSQRSSGASDVPGTRRYTAPGAVFTVSRGRHDQDDEHGRYVDLPQGDGRDGRKQGVATGGDASDRARTRVTPARTVV